MNRLTRTLTVLSALLMLTGCATLRPDFEPPTVAVRTIRALPSESIAPRFEIGLHIINPNRTALKLHGIACSLELEGHKILTGVANDLPVIDGYGEGDMTLVATTSLLGSIRLLADLMNAQKDTVSYDLTAKLDLGGLQPAIHVREKGEISLSAQSP